MPRRTKHGDTVFWTDKKGQSNKKVVEGPKRGEHTFYDPSNQRSGHGNKDARTRHAERQKNKP